MTQPAPVKRSRQRGELLDPVKLLANMPGPPVPLYLAGAPLVEVFPVVPILGNVPLGIGALSYAGRFNITVVADRDGGPDAEVFTAGLRASLDGLVKPVPVPS